MNSTLPYNDVSAEQSKKSDHDGHKVSEVLMRHLQKFKRKSVDRHNIKTLQIAVPFG